VTVAVEVATARQASAQKLVGFSTRNTESLCGGQSTQVNVRIRRTMSEHSKHGPRRRDCHIPIVIRTHQYIVISIFIYIPRAAHARSAAISRTSTYLKSGRTGTKGRQINVEKGREVAVAKENVGIARRAIRPWCSDDHVLCAVSIKIAGCRHRVAAPVIQGCSRDHKSAPCRRHIHEIDVCVPRSPSEHHHSSTCFYTTTKVIRRADKDVIDAVLVEITHPADGLAEHVTADCVEDFESSRSQRCGGIESSVASRTAEYDVRGSCECRTSGRFSYSAGNPVWVTVLVEVAGILDGKAELALIRRTPYFITLSTRSQLAEQHVRNGSCPKKIHRHDRHEEQS
jgi:hypothetical protein